MFLQYLDIIFNIIDESENNSYRGNIRRIRHKKRRQGKKILFLCFLKSIQRKITKISNYIDIVDLYDNDTFRSHFRLSRTSFETLEKKIATATAWIEKRIQFSPKLALLMTLWALANSDSYRQIGHRFGVAKGSAYNMVLHVCKILSSFSKEYIKWPEGRELDRVARKFNRLRGSGSFPNAVSCIDGIHISIPKPKVQPHSYFNRKGYYSCILQATCDSDCKFTSAFFGWPGRSHDANVWYHSAIGNKLENGEIHLPEQYHLLGDSAYPLKNYLMVPYKDYGNMSTRKRNFNKKLSSTRVIIEQSFGILMSRFRRLKFLNVNKIDHAKYYVIASLVLHNIIMDTNLTDDEEHNNFSSIEEFIIDVHESQPDETAKGRAKRNYITQIL